MFKRISFLQKRPDMSRAEFIQYLEEKHLPMCWQLVPPPHQHRRNYPVPDDPYAGNLAGPRAGAVALEYDCITEVIHKTRADAEEYLRIMSSEAVFPVIRADEVNFLKPGGTRFCVVEVFET